MGTGYALDFKHAHSVSIYVSTLVLCLQKLIVLAITFTFLLITLCMSGLNGAVVNLGLLFEGKNKFVVPP